MVIFLFPFAGQDGPTDATGVTVPLPLFVSSEIRGEARKSLANNDSHYFFESHPDIGQLIRIGLTGTNVMDLQILVVV